MDDVEVDGVSIPVTRKTFVLPVTGLPEPEDGTFYVVSQITAAAVPDRDDVFFAGEAVRNGEGMIIGCVGLSRA